MLQCLKTWGEEEELLLGQEEPVEESRRFCEHKLLGEEAGRGCLVVVPRLEAVVDSETGVADLEDEVEVKPRRDGSKFLFKCVIVLSLEFPFFE